MSEEIDLSEFLKPRGPGSTSIYGVTSVYRSKGVCPICSLPKSRCWKTGEEDLTTTQDKAAEATTSSERSKKQWPQLEEWAADATTQKQAANGGNT